MRNFVRKTLHDSRPLCDITVGIFLVAHAVVVMIVSVSGKEEDILASQRFPSNRTGVLKGHVAR